MRSSAVGAAGWHTDTGCSTTRILPFGISIHYGSSGTYLPVKEKITMATVTFDKATRLYPGSTVPAVDALDLHVGDGEFLVLVGPSGCG